VAAGNATIELGEGIRANCKIAASRTESAASEVKSAPKADLSSLTSMLEARWKGNAPSASSKAEPLKAGQVRSFKIVKLDPESKRIEIELA
jgi:small subunit ribosomal protein S1